jgi:hypothetical protein
MKSEGATTMTVWFHSTILATSLAATVAVGLASAAIYVEMGQRAAEKADRLPVVADNDKFVTVETRSDGMSVLNRIPMTN